MLTAVFDGAYDKEVYALLGFFAGLVGVLFVERGKELRRRIALLRVLEWQLDAFIRACRGAAEHKIRDSTDVESLAELIQQTFVHHPDLALGAKRQRTRTAVAQVYAEVSGMLGLLKLYKQQIATGKTPTAIGPGTYEGSYSAERDSGEGVAASTVVAIDGLSETLGNRFSHQPLRAVNLRFS